MRFYSVCVLNRPRDYIGETEDIGKGCVCVESGVKRSRLQEFQNATFECFKNGGGGGDALGGVHLICKGYIYLK